MSTKHIWPERALSLLLAVTMVTSGIPVTAFAQPGGDAEDISTEVSQSTGSPASDDSATVSDEPSQGETDEVIEASDAESSDVTEITDENVEDSADEASKSSTESSDDATSNATTSVSDYNTFLADLKVLEGYANSYVATEAGSGKNANALVINYIRTGVSRYQSGTWATLAGAEDTDFTAYVSQQDQANSTSASALKSVENFTLPNGDKVDFGHMFGTMDVTNYAIVQNMTDEVKLARADLGGWAGDTADMMYCAQNVDITDKVDTSETDVDTLADNIRAKYLGVDYSTLNGVTHSFTDTDIRGDLDAYYIMNELSNGSTSISSVIEGYFTSSLSNKDRAAYLLKNRFNNAQKKADIRSAVLAAYTGNTLIEALEASYSLTDLANHETLQKACCYAFADWLFELAGDENGDTPVTPDDPDTPDTPDTPENGYYTVFSNVDSTLAPGITQSITKALTTDNKQIVYYTSTIDLSRDDVSIYANYHDNDASSWAMARVSDQMSAAQEKHSNPEDTSNYIENYNAVLGINADYYNMTSGEPSGALIMGGTEYKGVANENFFGILKDGTAIIGGSAEYAANKNNIVEAVGGGAYLVKDGKVSIGSSSNYYNSRASRTCVGIKADGSVVMMVLDGRQEPWSAGGSAQEIAQIMLEAGCVTAINLDGGGSTTFDAKQEGSDSVSVVNRPSDGYERSVSSSLLVVSTAKVSNEFDHAVINSGTDYLTVNSTLKLSATGASSTGNAADVPEGAAWSVSDESAGTISTDGVFTPAKTGDATVNLLVNGKVVGSKILHVVAPDALSFTETSIDVTYGEATELPLKATYNGNDVTISPSDIQFELGNTSAGTIDGFSFTGSDDSGIRVTTVQAYLKSDYSIASGKLTLNLYSSDETRFDFDTATYGDRNLAFTREVSNSTMLFQQKTEELDEHYTYYVVDPDNPMVATYTYALDMRNVEVPEQLLPLLKMVAGGDLDNVTAWDILLQLAERVSVKTNMTVTMDFDDNVDVDITDLKLVNPYFTVNSAEVDKDTNTLTVNVSWNKQTAALDASTAQPIVIVSGIKLTPKDGASWDEDNQLDITNKGTITYDIYLGANALYSMANQESFQTTYGIYPYTEPENTTHPNGGHFASTFRTWTDSYTLDTTNHQGWSDYDGTLRYYKDNVALTGIQKLPGYNDEGNEYYYDLGDDGAYQGKLTGLFELDGNTYYAVNGELQSGWRVVTDADGNDNYYYFDYGTKAAVDGEIKVDGHTYTFTNHVLTKGAWETDSTGTHYYWAGHEMQNQWFAADGKQYFAYANTFAIAKGVAKTLNHERTGEEWYLFDAKTGAWLSDYSGLYEQDGKTYLIKDGVRVNYPGLFELNGSYYYINSSYTLIKGKIYYVSKTNGLVDAGSYEFDADGKMVVPDKTKNGLVWEDGELYYYVDGERSYAGLVQVDGSYYYFNGEKKAVRDRDYTITKTNDLLPQARYHFGADGKIVFPDTSKNGIVTDSDGQIRYYKDGVAQYAGLVKTDDGSYYYFNSSKVAVCGRDYTITKTNGLLRQAKYTFGADGKIVLATDSQGELLNGLVWEDGELYYYVDGEKSYAGLVLVDGSYYYFNTSKKAVRDRDYTITKTNGLLPQEKYTFGDDGKMVVS